MKTILLPLHVVLCLVGGTINQVVTATTTTPRLGKVLLCCPRCLFLALICPLSALFIANNTDGALGDVVAEYSFPTSSFVMHPTRPLMYATVPSQNSIAIINTNTLAASTVFVGSGPTNIALSPHGSKAYIANSTTDFVVVFDTQTQMVVNSFLLPEHPQDVVFGSQNRLWVLGETQIFQIDATTGASTGPSIDDFIVYSGSLEISPDRNTLYYGQYGLSPTSMYKFDVSGVTPTLLLERQTGDNGEDLTLSYNGSFICHTNGAPYEIAKYRTSDFASLGVYVTGPYPQALAFSPDDLVVYASVHTAAGIEVFNANTFLSVGTISGPEVATKLAVDSTGRYLFAGYDVYFSDFRGTRVYDTGRAVGAPFVSTNPATNVASSSATLNGSLSPGGSTTTVYFQYGPTTSYGFTSSAQTQTGNTFRDVSANISGLSASTTYHFRIVATNSDGTRYGGDRIFTTAAAIGPTPTPTPTPTATPTPSATPASQLGNISTRAFVQIGDDVMIGGFIVQGTEPKRVIIRAIGPELTQYGVPDVLADPTLELHNGTGALIASNDSWLHTIIGGIINSDQVRDIRNSGHAPTDSRESAIIAELPAGNYTAIVRGVNNTMGVTLAEVYDLSPQSSSMLANVSTRALVQTGDNVMIGGFIVQGTRPKRVILRAIGPELSQYGVPNVLPDPTLELHDGTGALIASNDNWQHTIIGGIIMTDQVRDIRSSGYAPRDPRESAIIADLPPGNYTGIVRDKTIIIGVALVEVYDLD
jgi:hypothetical protein